MSYKYTHFIPENTAPKGAKRIGVYDGNGKKVSNIALGRLTPPTDGKLYSFGLVSDLHLDGVGMNGTYLSEAMTFFESQGCSFCCHAGDMTNIGFWSSSSDEIYLTQMADYKSVIDAHPNLPMYGICGNHESYNKSIMENLAELKTYTGRELCYTLSNKPSTVGVEGVDRPNYNVNIVDDDVFIFIGQPGGTMYVEKAEWINELQWLYETLEENRNKRCFVFEHLTLSDDSGNPNNIHNAYWYTLENTLVGIMRHYKNAILFHGHSHLYFTEQENWYYSNYSTEKGFKSISIPSSSGSRITADGALVKVNDATLRSGYITDVYENCIVLRGYNFHTMECVSIANYKIDTALQAVEADTFTDDTGIIVT